MRRLQLVSAETPDVQRALDLIGQAGLRVTVGAAGYRLEAGPFDTSTEMLAHLVRGGFHFAAGPLCIECSQPAEQLCGACFAANTTGFGPADGAASFGEVRDHPSAARKVPTLEVVR